MCQKSMNNNGQYTISQTVRHVSGGTDMTYVISWYASTVSNGIIEQSSNITLHFIMKYLQNGAS